MVSPEKVDENNTAIVEYWLENAVKVETGGSDVCVRICVNVSVDCSKPSQLIPGKVALKQYENTTTGEKFYSKELFSPADIQGLFDQEYSNGTSPRLRAALENLFRDN